MSPSLIVAEVLVEEPEEAAEEPEEPTKVWMHDVVCVGNGLNKPWDLGPWGVSHGR